MDEAHLDLSNILIGGNEVWLTHEPPFGKGFTTHEARMVRNHLVFFLSSTGNTVRYLIKYHI